LLERGEWAWAISLYERALASDPAYAAGWLELGNAHMQAECLPEAIDAYQRAISLDATLSEAQANLAIAYREQGRPDAAIAAYRAALAHDPSDVEALLDLGLLLQEQEQWEVAFEAFQRARELSPSSSLLVRMADLLVRQEDLEGAVTHYRQALLALADTDGEEVQAQILGRLGVALHQLGHLEDAIHCYGLALRLRSGWETINNHRNTALERLKAAVSQARQTLHSLPALAGETGVDDGPESRAQLLQTLAVVLHRAGCLEEAIASCGQALELQPNLEAAQALRAKALGQRQDPTFLLELARRFNLLALYDDELHTLEQAAALAPDNRSIQLELGSSLLRCGHFQAGWPVFTKLRHPLSDEVGLAHALAGHSRVAPSRVQRREEDLNVLVEDLLDTQALRIEK
jgi:tetratricopeptide (TPR) repeat protein